MRSNTLGMVYKILSKSEYLEQADKIHEYLKLILEEEKISENIPSIAIKVIIDISYLFGILDETSLKRYWYSHGQFDDSLEFLKKNLPFNEFLEEMRKKLLLSSECSHDSLISNRLAGTLGPTASPINVVSSL